MSVVVALLAALAVLETAGLLKGARPSEALATMTALHARLARNPRLATVVRPLDDLVARLDARAAPSTARLLLELEAAAAAGALAGALCATVPVALVASATAPLGRLAWLAGRASRREAAVVRDLPLVLDLLAMGVEGGLPVGAAIDLAARRGPAGPLRDALRLVVAAAAAGRPRAEAVSELARSLPYAAVAVLVTTIAQADRLGGRLGPALRAQATQRRTERWHRAERRALLAPVRLLLPLALCILPATFVILLVPLALRLAGELQP